jgi:hypothetical protein
MEEAGSIVGRQTQNLMDTQPDDCLVAVDIESARHSLEEYETHGRRLR